MKTKIFMRFLLLMGFMAGLLASDGSLGAAPDFLLRNIDNKLVDTAKLRESGPIIINFWTTWCVPCRSEMTALQKLYEKYTPQVSFIAVSMDDHKTVGKVRSYVKSRKFPFIVITDPDKELAARFQASVVPTTVMVGSDGNILYFHTSYKTGDEKKLETLILQALGN
ncbi:MAG TPA: TlpA family protein disulfide reductase [Candidatus Marinimicrobia bacterium]|nr:TlpA family protein disulfide reductase [Candidatus Neomarinimicrobiota bacterium]